jgi:hypothetical protein
MKKFLSKKCFPTGRPDEGEKTAPVGMEKG